MSYLIYDIEIVKAIPFKNEPTVPGVEYCEGWHDHANMGISVIGGYDYSTDRWRVFCEDNFAEFFALAKERTIVSFNGLGFDNKVLAHHGDLEGAKNYDILVEIWAAHGLGPVFNYKTHGGFGLDAVCSANFGTNKTGDGGHAPVAWQKGKVGEVIDYCVNDIKLTKQIFDVVLAGKTLVCPKTRKDLTLRVP